MGSDSAGDSIRKIADRIAVALGQRDFGHMRETIGKSAPFLYNLSRWAEAIGAMSSEEYEAFVAAVEETHPDSAVRQLSDLESALPRFRMSLVNKLKALAPSLGGRPPEFQDRATERKHCNAILKRIMGGESESEALTDYAASCGVARQTMEKTWAKRPFINELSAIELVNEVIEMLSSLDAPQPERILGSSDSNT